MAVGQTNPARYTVSRKKVTSSRPSTPSAHNQSAPTAKRQQQDCRSPLMVCFTELRPPEVRARKAPSSVLRAQNENEKVMPGPMRRPRYANRFTLDLSRET